MRSSLTRTSLIAMLAVAAGGCGGGSDSGGAARAPARSGDVWVVASPDDRASAPAAVLAYVHGLHTFVLDGNDAYLGMTHVTSRQGPDGSRILTLPGAGDVRLVGTGANLELHFPGGETVPLQKRQAVTR